VLIEGVFTLAMSLVLSRCHVLVAMLRRLEWCFEYKWFAENGIRNTLTLLENEERDLLDIRGQESGEMLHDSIVRSVQS
jgi:hypothetical protein